MTADFTDSRQWRDPARMKALVDRINAMATRRWSIMEVCGGQTWTLSRYRLEELLPSVTMVHGPGCPVCVTPASRIDLAVSLARRPDVIFCSFGDMIRVPGSESSLLRVRSEGADVRVLYSPLDALAVARENPDKTVIFFAIGFETTTPAYALMAEKARSAGLTNLRLLTSLYRVPPAVRALKSDPDCHIDALLAAGHVCAVTGTGEYVSLARDLEIPVVITGFEPVDMLLGILRAVEMLERGETGVENAYPRVVAPQGSPLASGAVARVFEPVDQTWRGLGLIPDSGMRLRPEFRFLEVTADADDGAAPDGCLAARIMKGQCRPEECPLFGRGCTPDHPVGAPMVSSEGVCAAHHRYL